MSVTIKAAASGSQVGRQGSTAPVLTLSSGTLEALKWLALILMTFDHVNKHLLHASVPELFAAGRLAMPLFGFVLGYNLARPDALEGGTFKRTAVRLAVFGSIASVPFIALGGLGWGWWPFNVMATLLVATLCAWLFEVGGWARIALACLLFILGGSVVEFWWPGLAACKSQPVGDRRAAAYLCVRTGEHQGAANPAGVLCLLPSAPCSAVGAGAAAVGATCVAASPAPEA